MVAELQPAPNPVNPAVDVVDGVVHIYRLTCADPDLAALLTAAEEPTTMLLHVMGTGARILAVTQARLDTAVVEHAFAELHGNLARLIIDAGETATATTQQLLYDPQRGVTTLLERWRTQVDELLTDTFDPTRPGSATATLDAMPRR